MDFGDEDLFSYRGRSGATSASSTGRLTAHVAPVPGRRPDDRPHPHLSFDYKPPGINFAQTSGPVRRPPNSSHRYAADDYYSASSRYKHDFGHGDSFPGSPSGGPLGDLMPDLSGDRTVPLVPPDDAFRARPVARNPSPDRNIAPQPRSYQGYERQRFDGPNGGYRQIGDRFPPPPHHQHLYSHPPVQEFHQQRESRPQTYDFGVRKIDMHPGPRNTFNRSAYPPKGTVKTEETKVLPAVYELPRIQKKAKGGDELNESPQDRIVRLRTEHARLEMQIQKLDEVVADANAREAEIRRSCNGALADNKTFSDLMKFRNDAKRKLEAFRTEYSFKDDVIKKLMQKPSEKASGTEKKPKETVQVLATDFLDEKREEREEEIESSSKLEFFDGGDHWCQQCNFFATSVAEHLSHLQSLDHWAKNKPSANAPWPLIKRATNLDQERSLAGIKGSQFMIPCHGFYCAICKSFTGDSEAAEEHLFSIHHNKMVQRFFMSKPEYEHVYNKDRKSAQSKAEAEARQQKRDAEMRRLQEEAAKKKVHEEETRKRETEAREIIAEENKSRNRLREMDVRKEKEKLRRDRYRLKAKEREQDLKRQSRIQQLSREDDMDFSDEVAPSLDPKLKMPCSVIIPFEESHPLLQAFEKVERKVTLGKYSVAATSCDPEKAVWTKLGRVEKVVRVPLKPVLVSAGFNDDSCEEFSLRTMTGDVQSDQSRATKQAIPITVTKSASETRKKPGDAAIDVEVVATSDGAAKRNAAPVDQKAGSPMEQMILNALSDCLTPLVVDEEEEPRIEKHKKSRESQIEVITGDDDDEPQVVEATYASGADDDCFFPSLSLDDLVTKSP